MVVIRSLDFTGSEIQIRRHNKTSLTLKPLFFLTTLISFHLPPPYADDVALNVTAGVRLYWEGVCNNVNGPVWDYNAKA